MAQANFWEQDAVIAPPQPAQSGLRQIVPPQPDQPPAQTEAQRRAAEAGAEQAERRAESEPRRELYFDESGLRREFIGRPEVQRYQEVLPLYISARDAADTRAGDLNLTYAFGKVMDPGSVVREAEQVMVQGTSPISDRVRSLISEIDRSGRLRPETRRQLIAELRSRRLELARAYARERDQYGRLAQRYGFEPGSVVGEHPAAPYAEQERLAREGQPQQQGAPAEEPTITLGEDPGYTPENPPPGMVFLGWSEGADGRQVPRFGRPDISDVRGEDIAPDMENVDAFMRGAADIVTLGHVDEIRAARDTIFGGGTMDDNLARQREIDEYDRENNPYARGGGQVAASLAIPTGVAGAARTAATRVLRAGGTRAEAIAAARTAAAGRMAGEGAAFGGGYGFGSSEGGIVERAAGAAVSAAFGGAAGYGLGRAGGRLIGRDRARPAAGDPLQLEAAQAAHELGIDLPRFVAGGPGAQSAASRLEQTPVGGPVIRGARERLNEQAGGARDTIAARVGTASEGEAMGERVVTAARTWRSATGSGGEGGRLYREAERLAGDTDVVPTNTMQLLARLVREERAVPGGTDATPIIERYASAFAAGGRVTIDGARRMRSALRSRLSETMTRDNAERLTNDIMGAVGTDIEASLRAAGREAAIPAYREADDFWRRRMDTISDVLSRYVGRDGDAWGANVARAIQEDTRGNAARLAELLQTIPADAANGVRATLISRLGRATDGNQDAAGGAFSLDTFLTNWNTIRETRGQIFDAETVRSLNRLAIVANRAKVAGRTRNRSFTGSIVSGVASATPTAIGAGASFGSGDPSYFALGLAFTGMAAGRQYAVARLLASPGFAQRLARTPATVAGARSYWTRPWVAQLARSEPAIAADVLQFQQQVLRSLGAEAAPLAAESGEEQ